MNLEVIIADDHSLFRVGLVRIVETIPSIGHIYQASNGAEVLSILKERNRIDLVLLDVKMPIMDGSRCVSEIRKINLRTKIVMVTMFDEMSLVGDLIKKGINGYLLKTDYLSEELISCVMKGQFYLSPSLSKHISFLEEYLSSDSNFEEENKNLTDLEIRLIQLIGQGQTSREISSILGLSKLTVDSYRLNLLRKVGVKNTAQLVSHAAKIGII